MLRAITFVLFACLALGGCNRPKKIPDRELEQILKEFYLTNAYLTVEGGVGVDSADIYRPILAEHGYKLKDFKHTMNAFSKRKSTRVSSVVEKVEKVLEQEYEDMRRDVATIDSLDARAMREFGRPVPVDSTLKATRVRDTTRLRVVLPVEEGRYDVSYSYFVDSLEENRSLRTTFRITARDGKSKLVSTNWLSSTRRWQRQDARIETSDEDSLLTILFGNYPAKEMKRPHLTIDSLHVFHAPPVRVARDSLFRRWYVPYEIDDPQRYEIPQDSLALHPLPPGAFARRDSDVRQ